MREAVHPLPSRPSWRGAQFKKSTKKNLPLPLTFTFIHFFCSIISLLLITRARNIIYYA
jgi:hypothetical protein